MIDAPTTPYCLDRSGAVPSLVPDYAASRAIAAQIIASERAWYDRPSLAKRIAQRCKALCRRRPFLPSHGRRQSQPPAQGRPATAGAWLAPAGKDAS